MDDQKINEIVGYNESTDQYILQSGEITLVDSRELFDKVNNHEVVIVNGIEGVILSMSVSMEKMMKYLSKQELKWK